MAGIAGALAAATAFAMAVGRLAGLIDGTAWLTPAAVAVVTAAFISLVSVRLRLPTVAGVLVQLVVAAWYVLRLVSPDSLTGGIIPTAATFGEAGEELSYGLELLRFGAAPVLAVPGLVAIIGVSLWVLVAWTVVFLLNRRPALATAPNLVFYLQLATIDRLPSNRAWVIGLALVTAALVLTIGDRQPGKRGRLDRPTGEPMPRRSLGLAVASLATLALVGSLMPDLLGDRVPAGGTIRWRTSSGLGGLYGGGTALNPFVGLQQSVVSLSDDPVFFATVSDSAPPGDELYWNLITLDVFDGSNWLPSTLPTYKTGEAWEDEEQRFRGPTTTVAARIRIAGLRGQILPTLYSTTGLESPTERIREGFLVRADGTVRLDLSLREGWEYEIQAALPDPDIAALASRNGQLTPLFEQAVEGQATNLIASNRPLDRTPLTDRVRYVELPPRLPAGIRNLAREVAKGGSTPFEDALLLEAFFRDSRLFVYSPDVSSGHSSLDLEDWLTDPASTNYRTGYCEQFATAMAVMARTLDLPARVVLGFTPGAVTTQEDGSEVIVVKERNAHAWVELWLDGQGWVRFDPTPRSDGVNPSLTETQVGFDPRGFLPAPTEPGGSSGPGTRPQLPNLPEEDLRPLGPPGGTVTRVELPGWSWWVAAIILLVAVTPGGRWLARRRRLHRLRHGDITAAWEEITVRLAGLGESMTVDETPMELANRFGGELQPLAGMMTAAVSEGPVRGNLEEAFRRADVAVAARTSDVRRRLAWLLPLRPRR
jgi:transglutaminase-like putative cysteine protease